MFIPQPRVIERLADCRLNGYPDVNTESFYKGNPQTFDQNENKYNQHERINKVVNNIVVEPDTLTNVNQNGNTQQDYIDNMTNKLNNSNFNNIVNESYTQPIVNDSKQPLVVNHGCSNEMNPQGNPLAMKPPMVNGHCLNEMKTPQNTIMFTVLAAAFVVIFVMLLFIVFILLAKNKLHNNDYKQLGGNMFAPNGKYIPVLTYQFIPNNEYQNGFVPSVNNQFTPNNEHKGGFVPYNY